MSAVMATHESHPQVDPMTKRRGQDVSYYLKDGPNLTQQARSLLENYSHIPPDQVNSHVRAIRDIAWDVWPYPCIGLFRFMDLAMHRLPIYPTVIERLKAGEVFLDLGCC